MAGPLTDTRGRNERDDLPLPARVAVLLGALVLALGTVFLIPLTDLLVPGPKPDIQLRTVATTAWKPAKPPPKPPPPPKPEPPPKTPPKTPLPEPVPPAPVPTPKLLLPVRLEFNPPMPTADFRLDFETAPRTQTEIPAVSPPPKEPGTPKSAAPPATPRTEPDTPPEVLYQVRPVYPYRARAKAVEGYVDVEFMVESKGTVRDVTVIDAAPRGLFEEAACKAVTRWRFNPAKRDGTPVEARVRIRIRFNLDE